MTSAASRFPCAHRVLVNRRPWPDLGCDVAECASCHTTTVVPGSEHAKPVTVKRGSKLARLLRVRSRKANASK